MKYRKLIELLGIGFFAFLLMETSLRFLKIYSTPSELNNIKHFSLFDIQNNSHYYKHKDLGKRFKYKTPEFNFYHSVDELGFRNTNGKIETKPEILFLGDSFTEGLGASDEKTSPAFLENFSGKKVYNAGVIGSDIIYQQKLLEDFIPVDSVQTILFLINFSDIHDVVVRGGKERFNKDGTVSYNKPPNFMIIYQYSHVFRAIIHFVFRYDYMFNNFFNREKNINKALNTISTAFLEINDFCTKKDLKMKVFIHPLPQEYYKNLDGRLDFKKIDDLELLLIQQNIEVVNLRPHLEKNLKNKHDWQDVSWNIDGHFNAKGYEIVAKCIYENLDLK
jgi:hypothetical protein